jgi:hypothetical protein
MVKKRLYAIGSHSALDRLFVIGSVLLGGLATVPFVSDISPTTLGYVLCVAGAGSLHLAALAIHLWATARHEPGLFDGIDPALRP